MLKCVSARKANKTEKSFSLIGCAKHDNFLPLNNWLTKDEMFTSLATDIDCMMNGE